MKYQYPKYRDAIVEYQNQTVRFHSGEFGKVIGVHPTMRTERTGLVVLYVKPRLNKRHVKAWHSDRVEVIS